MTLKNPKEFYSKREKFDKPDECYTPENAIYPLLPFIKDFKTFTGLTPKEFYGDQLKMSLIFENNDSI